jgi:beta-xylosidase
MPPRHLPALLTVATLLPGAHAQPSTSGNPILPGWYADPEAIIYDDHYWIFPTYSGHDPTAAPTTLTERQRRAINPQYLQQTFLDAFSSPDLVTWTKHQRVLDAADIEWAEFAIWAPSVIHANDTYYLFFSANDIQSEDEEGGIGVAVADSPEGPYTDALGHPLIDSFHNGAQPIDAFVFRDDDTHYLYYGGWRHCNVAKLAPDLLSVVPFDDGDTFKEITPDHYVEGPFVFKRRHDGRDRYYLMWSEGGWGGPDYSVAYAIADAPIGPFERVGTILQQDPSVATGAGHHSVIPIEESDTWYIVYHRRPLGDTDPNHRQLCIDEMHFDEQGNIPPVTITHEGVTARPIDDP